MANFAPKLATWSIVFAGLFSGHAVSIYNVYPHKAIIFDRLAGVRQVVKDEGTHFRIPFLEIP